MQEALNEIETLRAATKENTHKHALARVRVGKVVDAYDGDSCRLALMFPAVPAAEYVSVRMLGYDAPEMTKSHREFGTEVRNVFRLIVLNKLVVVDIPRLKKADPYGRVLARLYVAEEPTAQKPLLFSVRGRSVAVPNTSDVAAPIAPHPDWRAGLLCVNDWMLGNLPIHSYDGIGARPGYSAEELAHGAGPRPQQAAPQNSNP